MVASRALHSHDVSSDGDDDDDYGMMMVMINKQTKIRYVEIMIYIRIALGLVFDSLDEKLVSSFRLCLGNKGSLQNSIW